MIFRLALAICHSPQYETDHKDSLSQDWAHVPFPREKKLLTAIADVGEQVAVLLNPLANAQQVVKSLLGDKARTLAVMQKHGGGAVSQAELLITYSYYGAATGRWSSRQPQDTEPQPERWGTQTGDLFLNEHVYFAHVPEKVWQYELGGYPVLKKWLGYRDAKRRVDQPLRLEEATHFRSMVQRIAALLILHERLDSLYEQAGAECFTAEELGIR